MKRARPSCARSRPTVGRERFDAWLKGWFDRHAFQPVTSAIFLADLRQNLVKGDKALEDKLMLDHWVYQPGHPAQHGPPAGRYLRRAGQGRRRLSPGAARRPRRWGELDHRRAAALPQPAAAQAADRRGSTRSIGASASTTRATRKCASPGSIWRSPTATIRRCPSLEQFLTQPGPRQVRQAADQGARQGPAMGPADRGANLCQGAAALSPAGDPRSRQAEASARLKMSRDGS